MAQLCSLDRDGKGYIMAAEVTQSMDKMGHALYFQELSKMIAEADIGGNGKINIVKFTAIDTFALVDYLKASLMRSTPSRTPKTETMVRRGVGFRQGLGQGRGDRGRGYPLPLAAEEHQIVSNEGMFTSLRRSFKTLGKLAKSTKMLEEYPQTTEQYGDREVARPCMN